MEDRLYLDIIGLRAWTPYYQPGGGSSVFCIAGVCDSAGKLSNKRKPVETAALKAERELKWNHPTIVVDIDKTISFVRINVFEKRTFRKREVGCVTIDLSMYSVADRVDRWFKLVPSETPADSKSNLGELKLRIRFADPPFKEDEWKPQLGPLSTLSSMKGKDDHHDDSSLGGAGGVGGTGAGGGGFGSGASSNGAMRASSSSTNGPSLEISGLFDLEDEPNVAWLLLDMVKHRSSFSVRINRLALNGNSRLINTGSPHWVVCFSAASRGIYVTQKHQSVATTMVVNEAFDVNMGVAFLVFSLHFMEQRSCATVSVALRDSMPLGELSSRWYSMKVATNQASCMPSAVNGAGFVRFPTAPQDEFRMLDSAQMIGDDLPNDYHVILLPQAALSMQQYQEWKHWKLFVLCIWLLFLLITNLLSFMI